MGVGDLLARGLADIPVGVHDQHAISQVDLAQVEGVQDGLLLVGDDSSASPGATTMTPAKVSSRFAARISSTKRVEPQMQTISGRSGTAQSFWSKGKPSVCTVTSQTGTRADSCPCERDTRRLRRRGREAWAVVAMGQLDGKPGAPRSPSDRFGASIAVV